MDKQLNALYQNRDFVGMANMLEDYTPEALAGVLGEVADGDLVLLCRELNPDTVADALVELPADRQKIILSGLHDDQLKEVMDEVSVSTVFSLPTARVITLRYGLVSASSGVICPISIRY